jgi:tyrosine-protein kinase Etk/Wzc
MKGEQDVFNNNIDFKKLIQRLIYYRKTFIVLALVFLTAAFLINRYSQVKYVNSTIINLEENKSQDMLNSSTDVFQTFGLFNSKQNIDNELEILKSYTLVKKSINETNLRVSYYSFKNSPLALLFSKTPLTRKTELYNDSPIEVNIDPSVPQAIYINFKVTFNNENEFTLEADGENTALYNYIDDQVVSYAPAIHFKQRFRFGDEIKTRYFNFRIQKSQAFDKSFTANSELHFYLNNINYLTLEYQSALSAETTTEGSTLILLTCKGSNRELITDFLNVHASTFLGKSLDKKTKTAMGTIDFIDSQISGYADSLSTAENTLKNFRTSQGVMDLSFQGQQIFEQLNKLENEKAAIDLQKKYYEYLSNYLSTNTEVSNIMAPTAMNVVDPLLTGMVGQLIELSSERASLLRNSSNQQNLYLTDINIKIDNIKNQIKETVKNSLNTLTISLNEINYRMAKSSGQISQIPKTELQLKSIERKFELNDAIVTFLLQKRAEAQIARASSMPDFEVVDQAILTLSKRISPKSGLNYAIALFLAFLLPATVVLMKDFVNNKFTEPDEVERLTNLPILGRVFHNFHRTKQIVNDHPNSSVTESFRAIRTNFQFFSEGGKRQVILITSSTSGEGKTFCSINLGTVFALNGHKTVLLEFDLRRPKIHQEFGSSNIIGISSFLIDKANIEDIILPTHIENLDLISAGPAAPNPAELISSERTGELIDKLKEMYDYIIIDSAPAGILTETMLLMKHSDLNIIVARMDKTNREAFKNVVKTFNNNKITNTTILINDLNVKRDSYKYGYDNKYYTDDRNTSFLYKITHKRKKASS